MKINESSDRLFGMAQVIQESKRLNFFEAAEQMYVLLHYIVLEAEAGKPLSESLLNEAHKMFTVADQCPRLHRLVYSSPKGDM